MKWQNIFPFVNIGVSNKKNRFGGDFMEKKNTDREYLTRLEKLKEQSPQEQKELLEKGEISRLQYEVNRRININIPKDK